MGNMAVGRVLATIPGEDTVYQKVHAVVRGSRLRIKGGGLDIEHTYQPGEVTVTRQGREYTVTTPAGVYTFKPDPDCKPCTGAK